MSVLQRVQHEPISLPLRVISLIRSLFVLFVSENVFLWAHIFQGRRNPQADVEGPYYVLGAPNRQLEDGKALIATADELKEFGPYLLTITVKSPRGDPVPHATFDWWQANTAGDYSMTTYGMRGKFTTDANGRVEVLTVAPGKYGPQGYKRAGHFHLIVSDTEGQKWEPLTTQLYVCRANDVKEMGTDFINWVRPARTNNMLRSWSIPSGGEQFMEFSALPEEDKETNDNVQWWNKKLAGRGQNVKIVAGAQTEIRMNSPPRWVFF